MLKQTNVCRQQPQALTARQAGDGGTMMKKAIATISTSTGKMTIYYNGVGQPITAETADGHSEDCGTIARNLKDARAAAKMMWDDRDGCNVWGYRDVR